MRKTLDYLDRNGFIDTWFAVRERLEEAKKPPYQYLPPTEQEFERQRKAASDFHTTISIVVPAYQTEETYLRAMIESVLRQTYPNWELILADASDDDSVRKVAETYSDRRIHYIRLGENKGIAENTNCALRYVTGEYTGLLDHDDMLTENALFEMAAQIANGAKILYSDEDKCNQDGTQFFEPNFKEDFNFDLLLSNNYICHFLVMESNLMKKVGFQSEYEGAQDYNLVLWAVQSLLEQEEKIVHIPKVLYHWRCHSGSTAVNPRSKMYAYEAGRCAVQCFVIEQQWACLINHSKHLGFYTAVYLESVFYAREDVAAVGGTIVSKGRIVGGRMTADGEVLYKGLPIGYSGYMHRACLNQDAEAVDIRCFRLREECWDLFEKITGVLYVECRSGCRCFDAGTLPADTDYRQVSLALCKALREEGYRMIYMPQVKVSVRRTFNAHARGHFAKKF